MLDGGAKRAYNVLTLTEHLIAETRKWMVKKSKAKDFLVQAVLRTGEDDELIQMVSTERNKTRQKIGPAVRNLLRELAECRKKQGGKNESGNGAGS